MFHRIILATACLLAWLAPASAHAAAAQWVMGYYVAYQRTLLPPEAIGWNGLTHIIMGRIKANADGTLNTDFDDDPVQGPLLAQDIAARAHAAGRKAILMLGGDDNSPAIHDAVANHQAAFIANLVATMNAYGYDGLDLDWENTIDYGLMQGFVTALRQAAPQAILTMPVGALNINYDTVDPHYPAIAAQLDRLSLMSYYPSTSWAGSGWLSWFNSPLKGAKPATPVSIDTSLALYAAAGVPKAKLGMGISFYATCYNGGVTAPNQSTENGVSILGGDNAYMLSELYGTNSVYAEAYRHWFAAAQAPYLSLPTPDSRGCRYTTYEDEQSILAKGAFSRAKGYGGIIIWTINQGYVTSHPNPNFLMDALDQGFIDQGATPAVAVSILQGNSWLHTKATLRFAALVTGTQNRAVTWSVVEPDCGRIAANGLYRAPAAEKTCTVTATSAADRSKTAKVTVTINNTPWTPDFSVSRPGTWWVEITAEDPNVAAMSITWPDGTSAPLVLEYDQYGTNYPVFAANYGFPDAGGTYTFTAWSKDNRSTQVQLAVPACNHGSDGICH